MGKPKKSNIDRDTIVDVFKHFGRQDDDVKKGFLKAAGLKTSDARIAAQSDCLPTSGSWKKIVFAAAKHGWTNPHA